MALKRFSRERPKTVGHLPHASLVRVQRRVKDVARRQAALHHARRAAERFERAAPWGGGV
jgi:hypothetical protein